MRNAENFPHGFPPQQGMVAQSQYMAQPMNPQSMGVVSDYDHKRGRGDEGGQPQQQYLPSPRTQQQQHECTYPSAPAQVYEAPTDQASESQGSAAKRSRPNNYHKPQTVAPSVLTALGSLVGGSAPGAPGASQSGNAFVPQRRRLSGGALEEFIGGHDKMETDTTNDWTRPRSMSL